MEKEAPELDIERPGVAIGYLRAHARLEDGEHRELTVGSIARSERPARYNRLLAIEHELT